MLKSLALVGLGGAAGSMLRFAITKYVSSWDVHLPLATFFINLAGCFLIGLLVGIAEKHEWIQGNVLLLLATGFCGGFTTFSTFALENISLLNKQFFTTSLVYSFLSVVLGILLCKLGFLLAK